MAGLGVEISWAATVFRVCAWRLCLAVMPVGGGRAWPGFETRRRAGGCPRTMVWLNWVGCGAYGRRKACGVWLRCLWAAAGPGRASRSITPSEARVWRSRGRAAAHRRNRPDQVGRPRAVRKYGGEGAAWKRGGGGAARERGRQEFSVRRRRSRRGRLRNRSRMGRCGPSGSRGRSRRLRRLRRCRGPGRGRRRRRPGRV